MKLILSFSGRTGGNCDQLSRFIAAENDNILALRDLNIHDCSNCGYECFHDFCKYHEDDCYRLYESMLSYDKVILIVPMYCGNPSSLYFKFNERCQEFFMQNESAYDAIISRLYIIGIYGDSTQTPDFLKVFEKWFECSEYTDHVLGIERHTYGQKMEDSILDVEEIKDTVERFITR